MGLDISLCKYKDFEGSINRESQYQEETDKIWKEVAGDKNYDKISKDDKKMIENASVITAKNLGLSEDGQSEDGEYVEFPSKKYPDHLYQIGYFRSSYNDGGLNNVLDTIDIPNLYSIFEGYEHEDSGYYRPDWEEALLRTKDAISKLKKFIKSNKGYIALPINPYSATKNPLGSKNEALKVFLKQLKSHNKDGTYNYSCGDGEFYFEKPLEVIAFMDGKYAIVKDDKYYEWYLQALEIVKETCEYVLKDKSNSEFVLSWSG